MPTHDPEELVDLEALTESAAGSKDAVQVPGGSIDIDKEKTSVNDQSFYPFSNESSFCLTKWYWSSGAQKSHSSLHKLIDIVRSVDFKPADIQQTKWDKMHQVLRHNDFDNDDRQKDNLFEGASMDTSWQKTPITITVPFNHSAKDPGPKEFLVGDFYHWSIVSVIHEKLVNPRDDEQFHYELYELHWQPQANVKTCDHVHSKLYTSLVFLEAHSQLQDMPSKPGCALP